ncbi:Protein N-acetyltransferase, RimJ/RimL family [Maribacter sedimenticola]|uniref:Protein N-acetyltransferase, RimJ/RimL family n=1 Tax=Maribacter sedimenticola TaxID=228956 RepID=A0ABY1SIN2_9FLAO|nr:GNAT family N-acetyltransferase [Maribacter sedimenticola]SNR56051.1 Protein N-acetyltransferase, RimJ/RimL family [Maribacter sedimenticola]
MDRINTKRLRLEPISLEDATFIYELLNSEGWLQFIGDKQLSTVKKAEDYIVNNFMAGYQKHGFGLLKVCLGNGLPIGICGLLKRDYLDNIDLGFAFLPAYEGFGCAYEASMAMMEFGKNQLQSSRILAICMETNTRSLALLRKLGFTKKDRIQLGSGSEELLLLST